MSLPRLDVLHYTENSGDDYAKERPGVLNISRLIRGYPAWLRQNSASRLVKKTLILTDWTANRWNIAKILQATDALKQLLNEGFEIYVLQADHFLKLSENNIYLLESDFIRKAILQKDKSLIHSLVFKHLNLVAMQVFLLDLYWMQVITEQSMMNEVNKGNVPSCMIDFSIGHTEKEIEDIRLYCAQEGLNIVNIISVFEDYDENEEYEEEKRLKKIPVKAVSRQLVVSDDDAYGFSLKDLSCDSYIYSSRYAIGLKFKLDDLENLVSILATADSGRELSRIIKLKEMSSLRHLQCFNISANYDTNFQLPKLTHLSIAVDLDDAEDANRMAALRFLNVAPNAVSVEIYGGEENQLNNKLSRDFIDFLPKSLLSLKIVDCTLAFEVLIELFQKFPNLQKLEFKNIYIIDTGNQFQKLPELKELKLLSIDSNFGTDNTIPRRQADKGFIDCDFLVIFLQKCSALEILSLNNVDIQLKFDNTRLSIKKLSLQNSRISLSTFDFNSENSLINSCPFLNEIYIDHSSLYALNHKLSPNVSAESENEEYYQELSGFIDKLRKRHIHVIDTENYLAELSAQILESKLNQNPIDQFPDVDTTFNAAQYLHHKPTDSKFEFNDMTDGYRIKSTKCQKMITQRLSQYILIKDLDKRDLADINDGICTILSFMFCEMEVDDWDNFIDLLQEWNGSNLDDKSELDQMLGMLYHNYKTYDLPNGSYIGDNIEEVLSDLEVGDKIIISNVWHALVAGYTEEGWILYDPNDEEGYQLFNELEDVLERLEEALGSIIMCSNTSIKAVPAIDDANLFILEGGLIALSNVLNKVEVVELLPKSSEIATDCLIGLNMHDTNANPAWLIALMDERLIANYCLELLDQRFLLDNKSFYAFISNSLQDTKPEYHSKLQRRLIKIAQDLVTDNNGKGLLRIVEVLSSILYRMTLESYTKERLSQIKPEKCDISINDYLVAITNELGKKRAITCSRQTQLDLLLHAIQKFCLDHQRPLFFIDSPDMLVTSSEYINAKGLHGVLAKPPGGEIHQFIQNHYFDRPLFIVDLSKFKAGDIVRYNRFFEQSPDADGTPLPKDAVIIGLRKSSDYNGSDLSSRFDLCDICSYKESELLSFAGQPTWSVKPELNIGETAIIEIDNATDWKDILYGTWLTEGDKFVFKPGELANKASDPQVAVIEIRNCPDHGEAQRLFNMASLYGYIVHEGVRIEFPSHLKIHFVTMPALEIASGMTQVLGFHKEGYILNPSFLSEYLRTYDCIDHLLFTQNGIIEANKDGILHANLTRNLTPSAWARLLRTCELHQVRLVCHMPNLNEFAVDDNISHIFAGAEPSAKRHRQARASTRIFGTNDCDALIRKFYYEDDKKKWTILNITGIEANALLNNESHEITTECRLRFSRTPALLARLLANHENVILYGNFEPSLVDCLAPLLMERMTHDVPSDLWLITEDTTHFNFIPVIKMNVSLEEKCNLLNQEGYKLTAPINDDAYTKLRARVAYGQTSDPWVGVYDLKPRFPSGFNVEDCETISDKFIEQRFSSLLSLLQKQNVAVLTGLTGVGKTTFVREMFGDSEEYIVYYGEDKALEWANNKEKGKSKILFIDEVDLGNQVLLSRILEGLHCPWKHTFAHDTLLELDDEHWAIVTKNPQSYGGERQIPSFIERHGNALVFDPMPTEFIYVNILKPIFADSVIPDNICIEICKEILAAYQLICSYSVDTVLITSRELEMIALLTYAHFQRTKNSEIINITKYYITLIAGQLIPQEKIDEFMERFKSINHANHQSQVIDHYLLTPSRVAVKTLFDDLIFLQTMRRTSTAMNNIQLYGGLGGIIVEGEPGIGKTQLMLKLLQHYNKGNNSAYDHIPVSTQSDEKKKRILHDVDTGKVILIDEMNVSAGQMEGILNGTTMNIMPNGERPKTPGSFLICTQNPATMDGRGVISHALARRLIKITLPPYTSDEMVEILVHYGLGRVSAAGMVCAFEKVRETNKNISFRDLLRFANEFDINLAKDEFLAKHYQSYMSIQQLVNEANAALNQHQEYPEIADNDIDQGELIIQFGMFHQEKISVDICDLDDLLAFDESNFKL